MFVEQTNLEMQFKIYFLNLTMTTFFFPDLGLDIQDDMGRHEVGFKDNTVKVPFGETGCRFESHFLINKVGSFVYNVFFLCWSAQDCVYNYMQNH